MHLGGCQNHGPLLGPLNTRCRVMLRTQKGAIILTTTHMGAFGFTSDPGCIGTRCFQVCGSVRLPGCNASNEVILVCFLCIGPNTLHRCVKRIVADSRRRGSSFLVLAAVIHSFLRTEQTLPGPQNYVE